MISESIVNSKNLKEKDFKIIFDENDEDLDLADIFIKMKNLKKLKGVWLGFSNIYPNDSFQKIFL